MLPEKVARMEQTGADETILTYATGVDARLSTRGWRVLFGFGVIHLLAMLALTAASMPGAFRMWEFLREGSLNHWFPVAMLVNSAEIPVMALTNALAVAGYWAGLQRRSAARWFRIYVPTELSLMALLFGTTTAMLLHGQYNVTPTSTVGASPMALLVMPTAFTIMNLPLVLLLFPRIRRACFAA